MKRKFLAVLLALLMVLSLLPAVFTPKTAAAETAVIDQNIVEGGSILHCFDWSYDEIREALPAIKAAGYVAVQTSPVQQPKDYNEAWTDGNQWWKLYQPLGFSVADGDTWLGTKQDLIDLCDAAEAADIYVIVDVVANHLANKTGGGGWAQVNEEIDPELYAPQYFHTSTDGVNDSSRAAMTQNQMGMPDLNTGNKFVQQKVLGFLKECVDCGVDGFRFDAAKHIELPGDPGCGSDFWPYVLNGIRDYAGADKLFIYGESLSGGKNETWVQEYTTYMALTDSDLGGRMRNAVSSVNAGMLGDGTYVRCDAARGNVIWVESHDTYEDGGSVGLSPEQIKHAWAIVGARADSTALYLARPGETMGEPGDDETWKDSEVAAVNNFKNHFAGTREYLHSDYGNQIAWIERGANGAVISKLNGGGDVLLPVHQMANGSYTDQLSGNTFTVSGGLLQGTVGASGIAVLYNPEAQAADANPDLPSGDYIRTSPLYLVPGDNWKTAGARFAMYVNDGDGHNAWVDMTDADGDGVYEAPLPGNGYWTNVIFCRMNPGTTENSWNNKWNQTSDLGASFTGNCYTVPDDSWDYGNGTWSNFNPYQGYYLVGNMNGWAVHPDYQLTQNTAAGTEEYCISADLNKFSRFKIVYSENGTEKTTWYPDGEDNDYSDITENGRYSIYFRPNGDGGDDWFERCIYVDKQNATMEPNDAAGFYLVGTMTNWKVKPANKLTEQEGGTYSIDAFLSEMDQFKVVYSKDGSATSIWFPDPSPNYGAEDGTRIMRSNEYHISFRPGYDGEGWFKDCLLVTPYTLTYLPIDSSIAVWDDGNAETAEAGDEFDIQILFVEKAYRAGYRLEKVIVTDAENRTTEIAQDAFGEPFTSEESIWSNVGGDQHGYRIAITMPASNITLEAVWKKAKPSFGTHALVLAGQIGVKFYMNLDCLTEEEKENSYMTFEISGKGTVPSDPVPFDAGNTNAKSTLYGFACYVNAIQMADTITATFHYGEEQTINEDYSIMQYYEAFKEQADEFDEETRNLVRALVCYGYCTQQFLEEAKNLPLGYDEASYAPIELPEELAEMVASYNYATIADMIEEDSLLFKINNTSDENIKGISFALTLDSETKMTVTFKPDPSYTGIATCRIDNANEAEMQKVRGRFVAEVPNIPAHKLGEMHLIWAYTGGNCYSQVSYESTVIEASPMSYVYLMLTRTGATENEKNCGAAIYTYWQAAQAYIGE